MVYKLAPDGTDGNKEPLIYSTRMLSSIPVNQAGAMKLKINVKQQTQSRQNYKNIKFTETPINGNPTLSK